jgi:hypothetical protein
MILLIFKAVLLNFIKLINGYFLQKINKIIKDTCKYFYKTKPFLKLYINI